MSNRSFKDIVGLLWRVKRLPPTGGSDSETVCPKGHPMDPSWTSCPRCEAESRAAFRSKNSEENLHVLGDTAAYRSGPNSGYHFPSQAKPARPRPRTTTGVLVTFTWKPQGDLFLLYEGRNVIGKGAVESEDGRPCDLLLTEDASMSNEHAVIICRGGRYELFARQSTNGTYADDQLVGSEGVMLRDGARIKTGETVWQFRKIESDTSSEADTDSRSSRMSRQTVVPDGTQGEPQAQTSLPAWEEQREMHDDPTNYAGMTRADDVPDINEDDEALREGEANLTCQSASNAAQLSELESLYPYVKRHVNFLMCAVLLLSGLTAAALTGVVISAQHHILAGYFLLDLPSARSAWAGVTVFLAIMTILLSVSLQRARVIKGMLSSLSREQRQTLGLIRENGFFVDPTILLRF
jgi:hypothetical protein